MTLNPRLKPGDLSLKSARGADGANRWRATGRCAVCALEVTESDPAIVDRRTGRAPDAPVGLMHAACAPEDSRTAQDDAPRVIRFNLPTP